jgi:hypothetical protein
MSDVLRQAALRLRFNVNQYNHDAQHYLKKHP